MKWHTRSQGMTLIEVLVAMALLSLLSVGLISTFQLAQRSYRQVMRVDVALGDMLATHRFLRRALESAYPFEADVASQQRMYGLQGGQDRLEFTAPMPLAGAGGHYRYELTTASAEDGSRNLIVRSRLDRNGLLPRGAASRPQGQSEEVLIERIQGIELDYLDPVESQWRDAWDGKRRPPALVRLRVLFAPDDPRRWPDLVIAPRVTDDANCEFDTVAQACRERGS